MCVSKTKKKGLARAMELPLVSVFEIIDYFDSIIVNVNVCNVRAR